MKLDNPNVIIITGEDGIPCISLPPSVLPNIRIIDFTRIQNNKETNNFKSILDELKKIFEGL